MNQKFNAGDRIIWNGDSGTFLRYSKDGKRGFIHWDSDLQKDGTYPFEQDDEIEYIEPYRALTVEDLALVQDPPIYTPHGYIVTEDGTVYALTKKWAHGMLLAVLFPEHAKQCGFRPPVKDSNVYHYQEFELQHCRELPVIRVAFGLITARAINKGKPKATEAQILALTKIFKAASISLSDTVVTDWRDMSAREALKVLAENGNADE